MDIINNIIDSDINEIFKKVKIDIKNINKKKILLIGYNGFLGRYFVSIFDKILSATNYKFNVDCYDNFISSNSKGFQKINNRENFFFFKQDICTHKIKKKYDYIIFLAGIASPYIYNKYPLQTLSVSYIGVRQMLTKSIQDKSKFIFFSSSEIYGNPDSKNIPTKESYYGNVNSFGPRSCYDEGKRVGETLCYIFKNYYGANISIIRPFNVFGPLMDKKDYRIVPNIIDKILRNKKILLHGKGNQTRTFCYITDAMEGFLKVILNKNSTGRIYNIGNPYNEISMIKLVSIFSKILKKKINYRLISYPSHYPSDEPIRRCPSIQKAKSELNFSPTVSVEEGLKRTLVFNKIILLK